MSAAAPTAAPLHPALGVAVQELLAVRSEACFALSFRNPASGQAMRWPRVSDHATTGLEITADLLAVGHGVRLGVPGILLGTAGAFGLTRFLTGMLYGVRPTDPVTFVETGALLLLITALASYLPARGAVRVEPARALRQQ